MEEQQLAQNSVDSATHPEISAIITCYYEEKSIDEFHSRLSTALDSTGRSYEIIFVNDGSTDKTFEKLEAIYARDPRVSVVMDLFKNAGQANAIMAGVCEARGETFLFMDSDLQLMPEELPLLLEEYDKGYDVVSGHRTERKDSVFRKLPSKLANIIMRKISGSDLQDFGCTFKLFDAKLIRAFEPSPFLSFRQTDYIAEAQRCQDVPITHLPRKYGKSGWTFGKLWKFNMDNIVLLSQRPFQIIAWTSLVLAFLFVLRIFIENFTPISILSTVTNGLLLNVIVLALFILLTATSMVGEFAIRTFIASKKTPLFIIRKMLKRSRDDHPFG
jgi:glycosyltransferase involved in cell wall biosynthesis